MNNKFEIDGIVITHYDPNSSEYQGPKGSYNIQELGCGTVVLTQHHWTSDNTPDGQELTSEDITKLNTCVYAVQDTVYCEECGTCWDSDDLYYPNSDVTIIQDCGVRCRECVEFKDVALELNEAEDVFKSQDMQSIEVPDGFEELDTLFCDSSGLGRESERARTKNSTIQRVGELLEEYPDEQLYTGLTGVGQFQVYVTVWRRKPSAVGE